MIRAFVNSANWIHLTSVQMARNRSDDFGRGGSSGALRRQRYGEGGYGRNRPKQPRLVPFFIILIIVLLGFVLLIGLCVFSLSMRLQKYTTFTSVTEVAELTILKTRVEHQLSIVVTRYDANGFYKQDIPPQLLQGDKVEMDYEYIIVPEWLEYFGLHSGYILLRLQPYSNDGTAGKPLNFNKADEDNSVLDRIEAIFDAPQYDQITLLPSRSIHRVCISPTGQLYEVSKGC